MSAEGKDESKNPKVDGFLRKAERWREELATLRRIVLECELTEELKWGKPCYTFQGHNIVILIPFKESCALLFCKGALLKDGDGILTKASENTQAARWIKFAHVREIAQRATVLKAYIAEAVEAERAGLKVKYKTTAEFKMPDELRNRLDGSPALNAAFKSLTPGRQRAYILYFSGAKQAKTREARVEKCIPQILKRKGLNE
jgi:uncharacterized protein YdeI (YjbR/CyaY-like superfamily)